MKDKKKLFFALLILGSFVFITVFTVAVGPTIRTYLAEMFSESSSQNASGLSFEIDKVDLKSNSGQVSFSIKSTTDAEILNNFRFKSLQICDQNDITLININDYNIVYNKLSNETEVVFTTSYIKENMGRRLTFKIIDLYHVANVVDTKVKIPLNDIILTGDEYYPSYVTGDNIIQKIGILSYKSDDKGSQTITAKLLYESTRLSLNNKSVSFSVIDLDGNVISREENVFTDFYNPTTKSSQGNGSSTAVKSENVSETGKTSETGKVSISKKMNSTENVSGSGKMNSTGNVSGVGNASSNQNISGSGKVNSSETVSETGKVNSSGNVGGSGKVNSSENVSVSGKMNSSENVSKTVKVSGAGNVSSTQSASASDEKIKTGGNIAIPSGDLSNYFLTIEYADYVPYKNGVWRMDFIPTKEHDDYKYEKQIDIIQSLQYNEKSDPINTDIEIKKAEFTTFQTVITAAIDKDFMETQSFKDFINSVYIKTAFSNYPLIKTINLTNNADETGVQAVDIALIFPTVAGERDPELFIRSNKSPIPLDTTFEYIKFRQAIGFGLNMTIQDVNEAIKKLEIQQLIGSLKETRMNKISNDEYGTFSITELYDGSEIYVYNDTYDKIASYNPKTKVYEIIYDPALKPLKPAGMSDEEWLDKKTIDEKMVRKSSPNSHDEVETLFGEPNRKQTTAQDETYIYKTNSGIEYYFIDNGIRFECWANNHFNIFNKPSPKTTLKKLSVTKTPEPNDLRNGNFGGDMFYYGALYDNIISEYGVPDDIEGNNAYYKMTGESNNNSFVILICDKNKNLIEIYLRIEVNDKIQLESIYLKSKKNQNELPRKDRYDISILNELTYVRTIEDVKSIMGFPFSEVNGAVQVVDYNLDGGKCISFWSDGSELECKIDDFNSTASASSTDRDKVLFRRDCKTGFEKYKILKK